MQGDANLYSPLQMAFLRPFHATTSPFGPFSLDYLFQCANLLPRNNLGRSILETHGFVVKRGPGRLKRNLELRMIAIGKLSLKTLYEGLRHPEVDLKTKMQIAAHLVGKMIPRRLDVTHEVDFTNEDKQRFMSELSQVFKQIAAGNPYKGSEAVILPAPDDPNT